MMHIDQEPDEIPKRLVRWSSLAVIATIALCATATLALTEGRIVDVLGPAPARPARVEGDPFLLETEAEALRSSAELRLRSYGWVNPLFGTIHVPLDVAIDRYLEAPR